tara:strand:+ start:325 stop:546 length:222 start_codon:yes stop_codon:yes gene_type:complete
MSDPNHPDWTLDYEEVFDAVARDMNEGFCVNTNCGSSSLGVEPDAEERRCDACQEFTLYGAERVLIMMDGDED